MTSLETQQRGLLDLIKGRGPSPSDDAYLAGIAQSGGLTMLREIALWWRAFQITAQCRLTSLLLKRLDCFDQSVAEYFQDHATSPFIEQLARGFLGWMGHHPNTLISAMARFELAVLNAHDEGQEAVEILWDRNPEQLFETLQRGSAIPDADPEWLYRMRVGRDVPAMVECTREPLAPEG